MASMMVDGTRVSTEDRESGTQCSSRYGRPIVRGRVQTLVSWYVVIRRRRRATVASFRLSAHSYIVSILIREHVGNILVPGTRSLPES